MQTIETRTQVALKNILFLTDFSEPSEATGYEVLPSLYLSASDRSCL
jgi:hypothetical protein